MYTNQRVTADGSKPYMCIIALEYVFAEVNFTFLTSDILISSTISLKYSIEGILIF